MKFFNDLKKLTFKQALLASFPYIIIGLPGFIIFEALHYYCENPCNDGCVSPCLKWEILRWVFLAIALFPALRNFFGGAIVNIFKNPDKKKKK